MTTWLAYDPATPPGTVRERPEGGQLRYVDAETYYVGLLGSRMNATLVFLNARAPGRVPADRLVAVDEAIARAYWDIYLGCVIPPRIRQALRVVAVGASGRLLLEYLESARAEFYAAATLEDATELHASVRLHFLMQGADRQLTDLQVATGEVMSDYLLLQRAVAEDIRRAERERADGEPRSAVLERLDRNADLVFEKIIGVVLRPQRLVEIIPAARRPDLEEYARRRRHVFREGVFATIAQEFGSAASVDEDR